MVKHRNTLSQHEATYLITLLKMRGLRRTGTSALAAKFGVKESSVVDVIKRLEEKGLLVRDPWRSIILTRRGEMLAEQLIHNHRVIETYLHRVLKISAALACNEAQKLDNLLDRRTITSMCHALNYPDTCIHGEEIKHYKWCRSPII
ncbi:MAG: metal-dependent transcriptional regulator [Nitrososphaerota archaeon]